MIILDARNSYKKRDNWTKLNPPLAAGASFICAPKQLFYSFIHKDKL